MTDFSLENLAEDIYDGKTKNYFQEVISSYQNRNYRSAVVMLWSVAVCDIIYKLQNLIDLYDDPVAKIILNELTSLQESDPKSSAWEIKLIDDAYSKTNLLDTSEYENLRYLQKQRHLSAHPVLNSNRELHEPNKETVRSMMRNTLEGLLIKPPFYTQKVINEFLEDIANAAYLINTREKVRKYVVTRYLSRLKPDVELSIYRSLWKCIFKLENEDCEKNRVINLRVLSVITNRHRQEILKMVSDEVDYYSNISSQPRILNFMVIYLSNHKGLYEILDESVKLKVQYHVENTDIGRVCGWFLKDSLESYYQDMVLLIQENVDFRLKDDQLVYLLEISDTVEWQRLFCKLLSVYYCASKSFNQADLRFQQIISPRLGLFDKETLPFLLECIESNNQVYLRGKAIEDHRQIKDRLLELYGSDFDLVPYPHFNANTMEE